MLWTLWLLACAAPTDAADPTGYAEPPRITVIYEPVLGEDDLEVLERLRPDLVCRGWFRWADARDYAADAWVARRCRDMGVILQGGTTIAAIYPRENGLDDATFASYVTCGPSGEPVTIADWRHVSLHNPAAREYLEQYVRDQIDAGVGGVWFDEIEGIYGWQHEGYDEWAIRDFARWLRERYVVGRGWAEDDPRFTEELGIPAAMLTGGIESFDYREWLRVTPGPDGKPLADNPWAGSWERPWESPNPLYRLWGHAWSPDPQIAATFQGSSVLEYWRWFVSEARRYARERYGRELVVTCNENGTPRPWCDFQQPHDGRLPQVGADGRLDATYTTLPWLDERIALAEHATPGKPVIQFVDWPGETDRLDALSAEDRTTFLRTYIPEASAAGALFSVPVRGYTYVARTRGALPETAAIVDFLRRNDPLLFEGSRPSARTVDPGVPGVLARVRERDERTVIHLLDHRPVEVREPVALRLALPGACAYAWTTSPGDPFERALPVAEGAVRLPAFRDSALVVLESNPPSVAGRVTDEQGMPIPGARVTQVASRRTALCDEAGNWALPGAEVGGLGAQATGYVPARGDASDFALARGGPVALEGRLLDALGCAVPATQAGARWPGHAQVAITDVEGRFSLSLEEGLEVSLEAHRPTAVLPAVTEVGMGPVTLEASPRDLLIGDFETRDLWTPNDSERVAGAPPLLSVALVNDGPHGTSRCMEIACGPIGEGWANAFSRECDISRHKALRFWYRGDGSQAAALLTLHALDEGPGGHFYTFPLSLETDRWREIVVYLDEFRREGVAPSEGALRRVSVQFGFGGGCPGARMRVWGVRATP